MMKDTTSKRKIDTRLFKTFVNKENSGGTSQNNLLTFCAIDRAINWGKGESLGIRSSRRRLFGAIRPYLRRIRWVTRVRRSTLCMLVIDMNESSQCHLSIRRTLVDEVTNASISPNRYWRSFSSRGQLDWCRLLRMIFHAGKSHFIPANTCWWNEHFECEMERMLIWMRWDTSVFDIRWTFQPICGKVNI